MRWRMLSVRSLLRRLLDWWEYDERMARHATKHWIRQYAELHPADKGEHW